MCPDLILMDLNMPVMDGLAATERIRELKERGGDVAIVAVTAFDTYGMREAAIEAGCDAYLLKPLALDELEAVVEKLLAAWVSEKAALCDDTFSQFLHSGSPCVTSSEAKSATKAGRTLSGVNYITQSIFSF